ncbi:hypothetical protein KC324_g866, partial [Hortaea werneckii]
MEHHHDERDAEMGEDDGGFTMDFEIQVVDDIEAQVEEMMRLGALGYFKEARQVSQSIAPVHQQKFEVVFEQLRLMLEQGAYPDLIARAKSYPEDACTSEQSALIALMAMIAHLHMNDTKESRASDALKESQLIDPCAICVRLQDRVNGGSWTIEELLEDLLSLRLWYLGEMRGAPVAELDENAADRLFDAAFFLLGQEQFWAAKSLFLFTLLHGLIYGVPQGIDTRSAVKRVQGIDESTYGSRVTKVALAREIGDWTTWYQASPLFRRFNLRELEEIWRLAEDTKADMERRFKGEDYGPGSLVDTKQVEVDSNDNYGQTLLSRAAKGGHEAVVKLLLDSKQVEVDSKDKDGRTPLSWAAKGRHEAVVKLLLDTKQVEVNSKDNYGQTPLSRAAEGGHEAVVKLLLDTKQVEVDSKDHDGRTPL